MRLLIALLFALGIAGCESCNGATEEAQPEAKAEGLPAPAEMEVGEEAPAEEVVPENTGVSK